MLNVKIVLKTLGFLLFVEGFFMLLSLLVSLIYEGTDALAFLYSALISMGVGTVAVIPFRNAKKDIGKREGFLIVSLVWIIFSFFGSLPFILSGSIPSLTDAFFETMSGFTTTGASVLSNIETLPHGILFWRSMTHWLGGMGIIVLSLAILPLFGIGGMQLFAAEVPGPTPDKLNPKISQTAKNLWAIYILFTLIETILLWIGGMSLFDAINHSFATMATGGFSTKQASIAYWDSAYIDYVIILFMFIAGSNFTLSYCALTGKFKRVIQDEEFKYYSLFVIGFTLLLFSGLLVSTQLGVEKAFRDALFQVVSIITTTGFATADYMLWQPILIILLFALFFFGGSAGSTGGGIKIMRIVLLIKNSYYELRRIIHPNAVIPVRYNKHAISEQIINNVLAFFIFYFIVFFLSTIIFTLVEPDMESSMGAVATCLGNIGPGLGLMGPAGNFANVAPFGKWFLSFLMLLGRLELFTVLVLFSPAFWKK
ncbi:MAG: potassium transporter [Bacteroidetes bacterium GWF2_42_66]|nr:MAG: potassium transporter [Bacteroidetes bacterium GWE2_42_39]OFY40562.1 MAG: potassium transporter [Bacteroidetes bacterium GWF2_42_66]HBL74513.1 potassium transporter [Prolixibacteraceae bacterium]HCU63537.1 potassium transporter [Prolixibacteraceae bacterium]